MRITFNEQAVRESERQYADRSRAAVGKEAAASQAVCAAFFGGQGDGMPDVAGMGGEKGKSLIELQQEAENTNVAVQQDYMILMSHTMSEEDYAKMQEEGFDFSGMEPEEAVTIVDRIKAELARSGKQIEGYTDDIDMDALAAALGSEVLAQTIADSFRKEDIPLTKENLTAVAQAWSMCSQLQSMGEGSNAYMIDNELEAEIWNLYLAQNSGAGKGAGTPKFYAEDVQGYYAQSAGKEAVAQLQGQIDRVIEQSGGEVNEKSRQDAEWLLDKGLPLTPESMKQLWELQEIELPVTEERFAEAAAAAVAEGKSPVHASLTGESDNLYQKAAAVSEYYHSSELWEASAGDLAARRQLEEIRLRMTAEVNVKLLKSGFSIDVAPMEELIEALKEAERQLADQYFPGDDTAVEKYRDFNRTESVTAQMPGLPADVLGIYAKGRSTDSLESVYEEGKALQENYEKAQERYEKLMTEPRRDLGDNIQKAFRNVDQILEELGEELTEENRRAVRILGYNRMEINLSNLEAVRDADRQVQGVLEKLTPAATLKMIRDGINPLEKSFAELEEYFDSLPPEYKKEAESYSRFLYGLERNHEITTEERSGYIGIYRLVRQIEKGDDAAVGALVNTQAELHFSNLLSAVRSGKVKSMDWRVSDELGVIEKAAGGKESISEQIARAFSSDAEGSSSQETERAGYREAIVRAADQVLEEVSYEKEAMREYDRASLEEQRQAAAVVDQETISMLQRGELPASADNLMAAQALVHGSENLFEMGGRYRAKSGTLDGFRPDETKTGDIAAFVGEKAEEAKSSADATELWQKLDDVDSFTESYAQITEDSLKAVEQATFEEADSSVDVRRMQLSHKQLTVAVSLAKQEEYFLPMYVGDRLARVHLTVDRSGAEKGTVSIGVNLSEEEYLQADFSMEKGTLQGSIQGILLEGGNIEVRKLQQIADTFKEEAASRWTVGNISATVSGRRVAESESRGEHSRTEDAELYRVAKAFLKSVIGQAK